jgi:uncharacterized protein DUF3892
VCVPVQFVTKDGIGRITHIGGSTDDGRPWGLSLDEAVTAVDSDEWQFFVEIPQGTRTEVESRWWVGGSGSKFLTTAPDATTVNNLDNLRSGLTRSLEYRRRIRSAFPERPMRCSERSRPESTEC